MEKILVITYYWPPSGGSGVQRWLKFVKYLPEFGFEPIVITVDPNKAGYAVLDKSLEKEISADIEVYRTNAKDNFKLYKKITGKKELPHGGFAGEINDSFKSKIIRFIRGNFFIPDPRRGWNRYAYKKSCEIIEKYNIKKIITTSPPHSTQLLGLKLKKKYSSIKWIADLRDPWTEIYYYKKILHTFIAKWIDKKYEKNVFNNADKLVVVSEQIKEMFTKLLNNGDNKINVIPNGFDHSDFINIQPNFSQKFVITYTGTLGIEYNIKNFIEIISSLQESIKGQIALRFIGVNAEVLKKYNLDCLTNNIEILSYLPHNIIIKELQESSVLLLVIPENKNNKGILTGKLFEYLGSMKPILCLGPIDGDASKIIRECNAGDCFDYYSKEDMEKFILHHFKTWELNKKLNLLNSSTNTDKYSRQELTKKLAEIISEFTS
ncbi:MAG: glycosyltransferase family 4 protein [Bacteroidota bacterium]